MNISDVSAAADNPAKNQVNIWYRQKTEITDEVRTEIVDWGPITYLRKSLGVLDFAVKYETGDRTPDRSRFPGKRWALTARPIRAFLSATVIS